MKTLNWRNCTCCRSPSTYYYIQTEEYINEDPKSVDIMSVSVNLRLCFKNISKYVVKSLEQVNKLPEGQKGFQSPLFTWQQVAVKAWCWCTTCGYLNSAGGGGTKISALSTTLQIFERFSDNAQLTDSEPNNEPNFTIMCTAFMAFLSSLLQNMKMKLCWRCCAVLCCALCARVIVLFSIKFDRERRQKKSC